jgi:hypothetical protein
LTYILRTVWSQWRCGACGSLLGIDRKRRLLALLPFVVMALGVSTLISRLGLADLIIAPVIVILAMPYFLLIDRVVVLERSGFRCQGCGYDLQGQTVPRCPECGREFDERERTRLETGLSADLLVAERPRRRAAFVLLIIIPLLISLGLGMAVWRSRNARLARQLGSATQPVTAPSVSE